MSTIVTRAGKGSPLTHTEVDNNFTNLNTDKAEDSTVVKLTGDQTIGGTKTFSNTITGSISGNAGTATNGVVTTGSYADPSWITSLDDGKVLPSMSGNSGKYLTTDGTNSSWDALAAVANSGAYSDLSGTPTLATVATSGSYNDLSNKPTIPTDLDSLSDVVITSPATNQSLVYNGTNWVNASGGGGVTSLTGTANEIDVSSSTGAVTISLPATINANLNGNASTATSASSADQAFEWKGSGSTSNWNTHFQDTLPASCTQIDINAGTNVPTGGGWWFAQSFRHSNSSNFWGTQYAHGWEDRAYQRYVRNVSNGSFGTWMLDTGARVWVNFNGTNAAIRGSGNVSSISFNGTGNYTVNFATALVDANYAISSIGAVATNYLFVLDARYAGGVASTTQYQIITANVSGGAQNPSFLSITIHR
jgi:hypothetical protein